YSRSSWSFLLFLRREHGVEKFLAEIAKLFLRIVERRTIDLRQRALHVLQKALRVAQDDLHFLALVVRRNRQLASLARRLHDLVHRLVAFNRIALVELIVGDGHLQFGDLSIYLGALAPAGFIQLGPQLFDSLLRSNSMKAQKET